MSQLFDARLDDYLLQILDITDTESQAIATHEFIGTDGAIIEQMGRHPREVKFRAFFFGTAINNATQYVDPNYANHFDFIEAMSDTSQSHKLIHPKYGEIDGYVRGLNIVHDDTQDYVSIDIDYIEKDLQTVGFISDQAAIDAALNLQQINELNNEIAGLNDDLNFMGVGSVLGHTINMTQSLVDQFNTVSAPVRDFLKETDTFLNQLTTLAQTAEEPFNTVTQAVNFVNDVPSRIIGTINSSCNRVISTYSALSNSPVTMMNNITLGLANFADTITGKNANFFKTKFYTLAAGSLAWQTGQIFQTDQNNRALQSIIESTKTFNVKGQRVSVPTLIAPPMSVTELEGVLYSVRSFIQTAICMNRIQLNSEQPGLMTMSVTLTDFTNSIKLNRLTIKSITVNNIPLHLLVTQLGLDYNSGDRILKLNPTIKCPNFVEGEVSVYVR